MDDGMDTVRSMVDCMLVPNITANEADSGIGRKIDRFVEIEYADFRDLEHRFGTKQFPDHGATDKTGSTGYQERRLEGHGSAIHADMVAPRWMEGKLGFYGPSGDIGLKRLIH
jgi:hypothetical protein